METNYYLMRKDNPITVVTLDDDGQITYVSERVLDKELLPLQYRYQPDSLRQWWRERSIPIEQGRVEAFLRDKGFSMPSQYLKKNLGLSLTDYYWIKPVDSDLSWDKINLFDNDFKENILFSQGDEREDDSIPHYSPNSSLQGQIEKTWSIINGERCLIKGNRTNLSSESINEVIATELHRRQGYDNYVTYNLITISKKEYDYGCYSKLFTSQDLEFISAYSIFSMEKKLNQDSGYEHYIKMCGKLGMDIDALRSDLEYQIMSDFIISGYDRHLNNFGILRDAETLNPLRMAPIYDSGASLYVNRQKPKSLKELLNMETNSFVAKELRLVGYVQNPKVLDLSKLPAASLIKELYEKDSQISKGEIAAITDIYEQKIDICEQIQLGRDPLKEMYSLNQNDKTNDDGIGDTDTAEVTLPFPKRLLTQTEDRVEEGKLFNTITLPKGTTFNGEDVSGCTIHPKEIRESEGNPDEILAVFHKDGSLPCLINLNKEGINLKRVDVEELKIAVDLQRNNEVELQRERAEEKNNTLEHNKNTDKGEGLE